MTMIGLHVSSDLSSLDDEGETKVVSINGLACLWLTKVADDHIGLCVSSGLPSLDDDCADNHKVSPHVIKLNCL